jgi:hypothetical protein
MPLEVLYDGKVIGQITTNHSMTVWEALELLDIDVFAEDGGIPKYEIELFDFHLM